MTSQGFYPDRCGVYGSCAQFDYHSGGGCHPDICPASENHLRPSGVRIWLKSCGCQIRGVPVKKVMLSAFMMCSMCAGLAGMLMTARLNAADAAMGDSYGLQTVAAVVVGGTSMLGGEGGVLGTVVGALILTIIVNVMNLKGISSYAQGW